MAKAKQKSSTPAARKRPLDPRFNLNRTKGAHVRKTPSVSTTSAPVVADSFLPQPGASTEAPTETPANIAVSE